MVNVSQKRVLIREDLNVPMKNGKITSDERIIAALPTIKNALQQNAAVIVMSHLGRPTEGKYEEEYSLKPVAERLSFLLNQKVELITDWQNAVEVKPGQVVLLENVRFNLGEESNSRELAKKYANLCDVFVMDAFASAHRAQASTAGVSEFAKEAIAGPLLSAELKALSHVMQNPARPLLAIIGGSKVSTKMELLDALIDKVNILIVGGGIANTLLKAQGVEVGKSLYEANWVARAKKLIEKAQAKNVLMPFPVDVIVAKSVDDAENARTISLAQIATDDCIFDIGPKTAAEYARLIHTAKTIIWNGPVGVFELVAFAEGTRVVGEAVAESSAYSLAGGGDTLAALAKFSLHARISYVSTGGGALLEYLEGRELPGVVALKCNK